MNIHRNYKYDWRSISHKLYEEIVRHGTGFFFYHGNLGLDDDAYEYVHTNLNLFLREITEGEEIVICRRNGPKYYNAYLKEGGNIVKSFSDKWIKSIKILFPNMEKVSAKFFINDLNSLHLSIGGTDDTNKTIVELNKNKGWNRSIQYHEIIIIKRKEKEQPGYESKFIYDLVGEYINLYIENRNSAYKKLEEISIKEANDPEIKFKRYMEKQRKSRSGLE